MDKIYIIENHNVKLRFSIILSFKEYDTISPSLQRQAVVNMAYGLYEVLPGTKPIKAAAPEKNPLKQEPPAVNARSD